MQIVEVETGSSLAIPVADCILDRFERVAWRAEDNAPDLVGADTGGAFNLLDRIKDKWRS